MYACVCVCIYSFTLYFIPNSRFFCFVLGIDIYSFVRIKFERKTCLKFIACVFSLLCDFLINVLLTSINKYTICIMYGRFLLSSSILLLSIHLYKALN